MRRTKEKPSHGRCTFQSTHSLRSATAARKAFNISDAVSIHALLAECDAYTQVARTGVVVSIHALLAECDLKAITALAAATGFNPRTPCGVRLYRRATPCRKLLFQSTHSLRSATNRSCPHGGRQAVSIHALLAECDGATPETIETLKSFNPRTPCGVRHISHNPMRRGPVFQSTHSLRSATGGITPA